MCLGEFILASKVFVKNDASKGMYLHPFIYLTDKKTKKFRNFSKNLWKIFVIYDIIVFKRCYDDIKSIKLYACRN